MSEHREFKKIGGENDEGAAGLPVDEYMASLEALQAEVATEKNVVWERVADGTLSEDLLKRLAKEYYFLGKWYTTEFGTLTSLAPDTDSLQLGTSQHFHHWLQNLADETGYTGDTNHVDMKINWAHQLGISDDELLSYRAMPESIGSVFTTLYYMRRSYEEGLATLGFAGERLAARSGYAKTLYEGLRDHYGYDVRNFKTHAYAEGDHGAKAEELFRKVATTAYVQRRCREAVRNVTLVKRARVVAMNRWVE